MEYIYIVLGIITFYFFIVFFLIRLVVPFMGFKSYNLPDNIPLEMKSKIQELENHSASAKEYLQRTYNFIRGKDGWHAERLKTLTKFLLLFRTNLKEMWHNRGYAQCTTVNYIFANPLGHSRFFRPKDIRIRHTFFNFVPHQYVQVLCDGNWIDCDPSVVYLDLPLGKRAKWLG